MARTRTTDIWALHGLVSISIGLVVYILGLCIDQELWTALGALPAVFATLTVVPVGKAFGLSEDLILTLSNHVSPLLIPGVVGIVSAKTAVTILQKVVTLFRERIG